MTCIICTASIDYVLVRALEHILAASSFISFCSFLCYSIVFSLLCLLHIVLFVVFFVDFFSCVLYYEALYLRPIRPLSYRHSSRESEIRTQPWLSVGSLTCDPYGPCENKSYSQKEKNYQFRMANLGKNVLLFTYSVCIIISVHSLNKACLCIFWHNFFLMNYSDLVSYGNYKM